MLIKKKIDFKCMVSLIPFFIALLPHLIWLKENNYITIIPAIFSFFFGELISINSSIAVVGSILL